MFDPERAAVLALHWQVNVIKPAGFFGGMLSEPVARSGVIDRAASFHKAAREAGLPIYFTRFVIPEGEGALVRNTDFMRAVGDAQEAFRPAAPGAQLIPEMLPLTEQDRVVDNQKLSGLAGSDLPDMLAARGVDIVFVTGVATNLTVEQTARHGTELGFTVYPVSDCVAAATEETHRASLANLDLATAGCRTTAQVLGDLAAARLRHARLRHDHDHRCGAPGDEPLSHRAGETVADLGGLAHHDQVGVHRLGDPQEFGGGIAGSVDEDEIESQADGLAQHVLRQALGLRRGGPSIGRGAAVLVPGTSENGDDPAVQPASLAASPAEGVPRGRGAVGPDHHGRGAGRAEAGRAEAGRDDPPAGLRCPHTHVAASNEPSGLLGGGSPRVVELMQVPQGGSGRQQRRHLGRGELADQPAERVGPGPAARAQVVRASRGQRYQHHTLVLRRLLPLDQAGPFQDVDERGHRRLGHALDDRQVRDAPWPGSLHGGQRGHRGEAEVPGLLHHRGRDQPEQRLSHGGLLALTRFARRLHKTSIVESI